MLDNRTDLDTLPQRIQQIYNNCSPEEQQVLLQILLELSETGDSATYRNLWLADYKEIPVDKYTFLTSPEYLGNTNNNGKSIYPAWMDLMLELERTGNQFTEIILTGATRTGKTSTAVSDCAYNLYKLMCLRDPQQFFGLKSVTRISIFFFNLNETLAKGVAFKEFNSTLAFSPWFQSHGHMSSSESNPVYIPDGGLIEVAYGSSGVHALGKATFCVVGDTEVLTSEGYKRIDELVNDNSIEVGQYNMQSGQIEYNTCSAALTKYTNRTIKVELEDGSVIEGTPEHKVLLTSDEYKPLGELTEDDDIRTVGHKCHRASSESFRVYVHTSPEGKKYVGVTHHPLNQRSGNNGQGYKQQPKFYKDILKFGWNNFTHEVVKSGLSEKCAIDLEQQLIAHYRTYDPKYGYNTKRSGNYNNVSLDTRFARSASKKRKSVDRHWYTDGERERLYAFNEPIPRGWYAGRAPSIYLVKHGVNVRVSAKDESYFISQGWERGHSDSRVQANKLSRKQFIWLYNEHEFDTADHLAQFLQSKGYPDIVASTVQAVCDYQISRTGQYSDLLGKIRRVRYEN